MLVAGWGGATAAPNVMSISCPFLCIYVFLYKYNALNFIHRVGMRGPLSTHRIHRAVTNAKSPKRSADTAVDLHARETLIISSDESAVCKYCEWDYLKWFRLAQACIW